MKKDTQSTQSKILDAAKQEFLSKGFEKASMRNIANEVGVSATALYRHFKSKEDLFSAFIEPVFGEFVDTLNADNDTAYEMLETEDPARLWEMSRNQFDVCLEFAYDHYDAFKLLLCCSAGTKYEQFQHNLVEEEVKSLLKMHAIVKKRGYPVNDVNAEELHLIMSGFFFSLFEVITHDYSREQAVNSARTLSVFFHNGIRAVVGF